MDIKIYTFFYNPVRAFEPGEEYVNVWAGKSGRPESIGFTGDDTGDNISAENRYFSELTGLYWIWKNTDSEVVGSCHYRRFFTIYEEPFFYKIKRFFYSPLGLAKKRQGLIYTNNLKYWGPRIIRSKNVAELLKDHDAILPQKRHFNYTVYEHYKRYHQITDLYLIREILQEKSPEYLTEYEKVMNGKTLFANNMFILPRVRFNLLMDWLFDILFEFRNRINPENYTGYQQRIFGFLSERLITVWIEHNQFNYIELPLIYFKKLKPAKNA